MRDPRTDTTDPHPQSAPLDALPFFSPLDATTRDALARAGRIRTVRPGERISEEGAPSETLLVLLRGTANSVRREGERAPIEHVVGELSAGATIGEVGFFDRQARPRGVVMTSEGDVLEIPYAALDALAPVRALLGQRLAARVRDAGRAELESARHRAVLGELIVKVIVLLCGYALLLAGLPRLQTLPSSSSMISLPLIALMAWGSWRFLRNTGYPMADFGLGRAALLPSLALSIGVTPALCAAAVGIKWLLLRTQAKWAALPLIEHTDWAARLRDPTVLRLLLIYFASSVAQELAVRSALQSGLESFLLGKRSRRSAIFVAALMFSVNHLHMSFLFAALAFLPAVVWGWMFARHRHLVGPTLSHFVFGAFVFFFLGISLP
jgi:membrane protease YdiL (CAAX protease family)